MIGIIILGVVALAELACILYILRIHAEERHKLLDRIQAPEAPRMAAMNDLFPEGREAPAPEDVLPPLDLPWDDDLQLISTDEERA